MPVPGDRAPAQPPGAPSGRASAAAARPDDQVLPLCLAEARRVQRGQSSDYCAELVQGPADH